MTKFAVFDAEEVFCKWRRWSAEKKLCMCLWELGTAKSEKKRPQCVTRSTGIRRVIKVTVGKKTQRGTHTCALVCVCLWAFVFLGKCNAAAAEAAAAVACRTRQPQGNNFQCPMCLQMLWFSQKRVFSLKTKIVEFFLSFSLRKAYIDKGLTVLRQPMQKWYFIFLIIF